jgi:serine/threonine protein kinase
MNAVNHTDTSQPAEDHLAIGFQDGLGAPLHESSEFAGKTLATAFPEPSKEELEAENAIYEEEQPIDADPVEAINVSAHAVSLPTEEEDEDEEDPGEVTTLAFAPPPDPELLADGPAPLTGEEDTDYLDEPIQVDAAAPEEQEEQVEPLPEEASTEPPSEPEVETAASASLSTLTDGELVSESDEEEPVETLEPIDDEDDEEDDPGEMTSLAPATLTPPAKADQLLSDILDNSMIVDAALAANEEETESGAVPTAPVTEDTPISPLSSQSIPVDGPSEPQATSQLDLSDAVLDEVDDTGEHAAINGHDTASGPPPASAANIGSLSSDVPPHTLGGPDSPVASDYLPASLLSPPTSSGPPPQASAPGSALFAALASPPTPSAPSEPPPPRMPETVALPIEQVIPDALSARASTPVPGTPETVALPLESVIPPEAHAVGGVAQHQHHAQHIAQQQAPMHQHMMQQPAMQHHSAPPSHAPSTESLPVGQERFGKFILLNRVALGGMAEVFRAKFEGPGGFQKLVAIKRILPEYMQDHNFLQMFMDEARIAGSLRHPTIVQIHELGEIEGVFFISMEFIDGIDLARVIKIRRALQVSIPHEIILDIGIAVCRALDYAHKECDPDGRPLRMIHRDVTPHNILISKKGECKLTDFGIAKAARNVAETAVGELKGKISYMSPEQAEGLQLDVRSDIFQVGIVMYEMLTLQKMFEGNSDQSILNKIQTAQFTPPRRLSPGIPKAIHQDVMKALATEPGKRYQSSPELQRALTQCKAQIRIKEPTEIAEFAKDILVQRDELLAQHAAARRQNVQEHGFSRLEHHQPSAQSKPSHTAPKASGQGTRWMIAILVMLLIIGASGTGYLLWNKPKPVPTVGLSVFTIPAGADIYLDKKRIGETPLFEKRFPFDQKIHTVRIEKLGYKPYFRSFQYNAPDDTQGIRVVLVKKGSKTKVFRAPVPRPKTFLPQKMKKK